MNPRQKNKTPIDTAIAEIIFMNKLSSLLRGVSTLPEEEARFAIYPITVLSPVKMTIPAPFP
jgi:hypothetical protein